MSYIDRNDIKYRPLERSAWCRGCDKLLQKGTFVISTYSSRNRGQYIYFCKDCVELMNLAIKTIEEKS